MKLLTPLQVAEIVQLDRRVIYRALEEGELQAFKPRGRWRVTEEALTAWLEASRPTVRAPRLEVVPSRPAPAASTMRAMLRDQGQ